MCIFSELRGARCSANVPCHMQMVGPMPSPTEKSLSLEFMRTKLLVIVDEWRETPHPTNEQVARWAELVSDLTVRIAAMVAAPAEK